MASKLKNLPVSDNTVKDGIDKMENDLHNTLVEELKIQPFFLQLDETSTVADKALIAYVQYIKDGKINQGILLSTNLSRTTRDSQSKPIP